MKLLFDDRFAPITSEIGFLECDVKSVAEAYLKWESDILRPYGMRLEAADQAGGLESVLLKLLPLTSPIRCRYAFVPTRSSWTGYFDNGVQGTDAASAVSVLAQKLNCRGVRAVFIPDTRGQPQSHASRRRFGGTILEVYTPDGTAIRTISIVNDGGKWQFDEIGAAFPFEDISAYRAKRGSDRFTGEMLSGYLEHLGIVAFDESFFTSKDGRPAIVVTKSGKLPKDLKEVPIGAA